MKITIEHDDGRKVQVPATNGIILGFLRPDGSTGVIVDGIARVGELLTMLYGVQTFTLQGVLKSIGVVVGTLDKKDFPVIEESPETPEGGERNDG